MGNRPPMSPCPKPPRTPKKKREPMKRTRMQSRGPRTKKSGGALFPKNVDEGLRVWIRGLPCIVAGRRFSPLAKPHECVWPVQVCHVKNRGAGGADHNNVVPMCADAHLYQHAIGLREFEQRAGVNLKAIAKALTAQYEAEKFPCP